MPVFRNVNRREVQGILLLDKPKGISSNAALQIVKRLFKAKKAGHTGSLDPVASGLLPICFGEATKFSQFLLEADKHYQTTAVLGIRTDTGDIEGNVVSERPVPDLNSVDIETILDRFRGRISQIPSMFSAIKHQGQPLYKLARQGIVIEREARELTIKELKVLELKNNTMRLEIRATKGTYVRTLVEDIGEALGCGAHVVELRRLGSGPYTAEQMLSFEILEHILEQEGIEKLESYLLPVDTSVAFMPDLRVSEATSYYLRQGQPVQIPYAPTSGWVRFSSQNGRFLGVGEILEDGRVAPRRLTQEMVSL
ncbi:MAG TPA: tRNA pseudouridine(55) synthase TruB [Gammaproteobacteria bacterium]|nr:tRNA pseudouridine(55) synthase TruB [Gammaproteobacteria bacterium]HRA42084.1 tRNA pseudouridine(55) synthase TruB [Gammaproteobacteria bacterium]